VESKLLHDVEEARKLLSLGRTRFYKEVQAGRLTIVKAGKKSLVPQSELDRYVETKIAEARASQ
jgi:excisionase family DNA binding protein